MPFMIVPAHDGFDVIDTKTGLVVATGATFHEAELLAGQEPGGEG